MARYISQSEFDRLISFSQPNCVSLYIPTDRTNADPRQNSIRFKNIVNKAITQLAAMKADKKTRDTLDKVCEELLADPKFWKDQAESLAIFVVGDWVEWYSLSISVPDLFMVTDHLYILPLIAMVQAEQIFYILELDRDHTRVWQGDQSGLSVVEVADLPESVTEVTGVEVNERQLQFHTGTDSPRGATRNAAFHGSSSWKDDKDRYLERFLKAVDKAMATFLKDTIYPLMLAGVEELVVMYRQISRSPQLVADALPKIPDPNRSAHQLHEKAVAVMQQRIIDQHQASVTAFLEQPKADRRVTTLPEVLRTASEGKIDTVFITENVRRWGTFDVVTQTLLHEANQQPRSTELHNLVAILTLRARGTVVALPPEEMPVQSPVAALLRY